MNARFLPPLIEPDVRISRIRLSDHLRPAACAAILPDDSPFPPFGTADIVHEGSDIPIVSWQSPSGTDAYAEAITATRSEPPSPLYGMSGCCCRPESRYTTHSKPGSASGSPRRQARSTGSDRTTSRTRRRILRHAFARGHINSIRPRSFPELKAQKRETLRQRRQPTLLLVHHQMKSGKLTLQLIPRHPAPVVPFAPAAPYRPHNGPAEHCRVATPSLRHHWRSTSCRKMLHSDGEITPPCGEPRSGCVTLPSSMTPAFSQARIRRKT